MIWQVTPTSKYLILYNFIFWLDTEYKKNSVFIKNLIKTKESFIKEINSLLKKEIDDYFEQEKIDYKF